MTGCYKGCYYYTDSCFRDDCFKGNNNVIRNRAELNMDSPPGQIVNREQPKYLKDVIRKYYEEEGYTPPERVQATLPSTQAEERLQRVLGALEGLARQAEARQGAHDRWWAQELRLVVKENTNKA